MATNPVFPLYYNDMDRSTRDWTDSEYGCFMRLLVHQWAQGYLPSDMERLCRIAPTAEKNWAVIGCKFTDIGDGKIQNIRLEKIRNEQIEFKKKQSENGKKGGNPAFKKGYANPYNNPSDNPKPKRRNKPKDKPSTSISPSTSLSTSPSDSISENSFADSGEELKFDVAKTEVEKSFKPAITIWNEFKKKVFDGAGTFTGLDGKSLKSILKKIEEKITVSGKNENVDSGAILNGWRVFLDNINNWGEFEKKNSSRLSFIDQYFDTIYSQLKNLKSNGQITKEQLAESVARIEAKHRKQAIETE